MSQRPQQSPREVIDFRLRPGGASEHDQLAPVADLPGDEQEGVDWRGDEEWISTLPDPHDASVIHDIT